MADKELKVEEKESPKCETNTCYWYVCRQCYWYEAYGDGWCRYDNAPTSPTTEACGHFK